MRVCHRIDPVFDDPNLIGFGGLPAVMSLAQRAGLHDLVDQHVRVPGSAGANAAVKVAGMGRRREFVSLITGRPRRPSCATATRSQTTWQWDLVGTCQQPGRPPWSSTLALR